MVAALTMTVVSCGKGENANNDNKEEATNVATNEEIAKDFTKYDGEHMTFSYPEGMKETISTSSMMNAANDDGTVRLDATFNDGGTKADQLEGAGQAWVGMKKNEGFTPDEPKVEGNVLTLRSVKDDMVDMFFLVVGEGTNNISGSLKFPKAAEEEYAPKFKAMLSTITFK